MKAESAKSVPLRSTTTRSCHSAAPTFKTGAVAGRSPRDPAVHTAETDGAILYAASRGGAVR